MTVSMASETGLTGRALIVLAVILLAGGGVLAWLMVVT